MPKWVDDAFENKSIEVIAMIEFLLDNHNRLSMIMHSYQKEEEEAAATVVSEQDDDACVEVLWKEVKALFNENTNALVSPRNSRFIIGNCMQEEFVSLFLIMCSKTDQPH
jgi:hypothetical protein